MPEIESGRVGRVLPGRGAAAVRTLILAGTALLLTACGQREAADATGDRAGAPEPGPPLPIVRVQDVNQVRLGQAVYQRHCSVCHGPDGRGQPGDWRVRGPDGRYPPPPLDDSAHAWHHPTAELRRLIAQGVPGSAMPAWQGRLSEGEIEAVVAYIKSLWSDPVYAVWYDIERRALEN